MADDPIYHDGMRRLQDLRETRAIADRLATVTLHATFTAEDRALIERCSMLFMASVRADDPPLAAYPGAVLIVRVTATRILPNCPRYMHKMHMVEHSVYAPRPDYEPPIPGWKTRDEFRDALPRRDRIDRDPEPGK